MKKSLLFVTLLLTLSACNGGGRKTFNFDTLDSNTFETTEISGELGSFDLVSPASGIVVEGIKEFSWSASTNAATYTLEICSSELFIENNDAVEYYSRKNITTTSFNISATFEEKNTTYYWRVTAYNKDGSRVSNSVYNFYLKAPEVEEVEFEIGDADDWTLHSLGSYADIGIDDSDFFGNGKESLVLTFDEEDTNQGIIESDGWIIVTKTVEKSIYGTDSMMFNMYYSGQDANILIRLVDKDNEYWYAPIQVSNNAKQTVFLRFEDFIQRKKDVTVANEVFDYERIKYMEIVFERSFGDGIFLLSNVRAIKFAKYQSEFITQVDFSDFDDERWNHQFYNFNRTVNEGELSLGYEGLDGYGFADLAINKYLYTGDSIKVSVKYTGSKGTNAVIRIIEEDKDRWSFKIPFNSLTSEYQDIVIPYSAFGKSEFKGDGRRQFYFILDFQFGLEGVKNGTGELCFKDIQVVNMKNYSSEDKRVVKPDGMIEDFDSYKFSSELYFIWQTSEVNKDEYMSLNSTKKVGSTNVNCGQFEYKSDMDAATYTLPIQASGSFNAFSLWIKDDSLKSGDARVGNISNISPEVNIYIELLSGEIYRFTITDLDKVWREYVIPYHLFTLTNEDDLSYLPVPISNTTITKISVAMQYFYHDALGNAIPVYSSNNPVYFDNIRLTEASNYNREAKEKVAVMVDGITLFDDFENYQSNADLEEAWTDGFDRAYQLKELSNDVPSGGGSKSMKLQYKSKSDSVSYVMAPSVDEGVRAKALRIWIKGDGKATIYLNIYLNFSGNTLQYRATLSSVADTWKEYVIGFNHFAIQGSTTSRALQDSDIPLLSKFTIGIVYSGGESATLGYIYIDNFKFDNTSAVNRESLLVL